MNHLHGSELTDAIFDFCRQFRELNLSESELALVLPLHLCYSGKTSIVSSFASRQTFVQVQRWKIRIHPACSGHAISMLFTLSCAIDGEKPKANKCVVEFYE